VQREPARGGGTTGSGRKEACRHRRVMAFGRVGGCGREVCDRAGETKSPQAVVWVTKDARPGPMKAVEGGNHAMISALLHLLGQHGMSRGEAAPKTASRPAESAFLETFESSLEHSPHEIRQANLRATPAKRAPVDPESPPVQTERSHEVKSYLKTVDRLTTAPDGHALDVFE